LLDTGKILIKPTLQTDHELDTGGATGVDSQNGLLQVGRNGLFAKDVLSVFGTGNNLIGMKLTRGADPYRFDIRMGDHVLRVRAVFGDSKPFGGIFGAFDGGIAADAEEEE